MNNDYIAIFLVLLVVLGCWIFSIIFGDGVIFRQHKNRKTLDSGFKAMDRNKELISLHGSKAADMEEYKNNVIIVNGSIKESSRLTDVNKAVYDSW